MSNNTSSTRWRVIASVATCALALAACGEGSDDRAEPEAEPTSSAASEPEATDPAPQTAEEVEVLDTGAEPRVVALPDPEVGDEYESSQQLTMTTSFGPRPSPAVPMSTNTSTAVLEVTEDVVTVRTIFDEVEVDDSGLPEDLVTGIESGLDVVRGLAVTLEQSRSGAVLDTRFSLPDDAPPAAHQVVEQIADSLSIGSVAFPSEPVGEGASWRVVSTTESNGLVLTQATTYVLEELDGDAYEMSLEVEGTFEPGDIDGAELVRGSTTGSGDASGTVGDLLPSSAASTGSTTLVVDVDGSRVESEVDVETTMATTRR